MPTSMFWFMGVKYLPWYPHNALVCCITFVLSGIPLAIFLSIHLYKSYRKPLPKRLAEERRGTDVTASKPPDSTATEVQMSSQKSTQDSNTTTSKRISGMRKKTATIKQRSRSYSDATDLHRYATISRVLTIFTVSLYTIHCFFATVTFTGAIKPRNSINCSRWMSTQAFIFHIARVCMYTIVTLRLEIAFDNSVFRYSRRVMYALYSVLSSSLIAACIGDYMDCRGELKYDSGIDGYSCFCYCSVWGMVLSQIVDIGISMFCLFLFLRPLRILLSNVYRDERLYSLTIRISTLTLFAVVSSQIMFILSISLSWGHLISIDNAINGICLLLMEPLHTELYYKVCGKCDEYCQNMKALAPPKVVDKIGTAMKHGNARSTSALVVHADIGSQGSPTPSPVPITPRTSV